MFRYFIILLCINPLYARFIGVDPARQYENPYSYGGNNPVMMIDPGGKIFLIANSDQEPKFKKSIEDMINTLKNKKL